MILEQTSKYARGPVVAGLLVIGLISMVIVIGGSRFSRADFLEVTRNQQARELDFLGQAIHYGPLSSLPEADLRDEMAPVAATAGFDAFMRRSLFGMDIAKLDIFGLDGSVIYTTDPASTRSLAPSDPMVRDARHGMVASALEDGVAITDLSGRAATRQVSRTFGLMLDRPPDAAEPGRPMAILAVHRDVGGRLASVDRTVWSVAGVFFGGLSAVLLIVNHVSARSRRRLEAANVQLRHREAAVRESRERMVRADEAAKRAIAEELHGTVQTRLYAVWMKLGIASGKVADEAVRGELDTLAEDVERIREEEIRQLSHRLHPSIVRVGAAAALRSLRDFYESIIPVELEIGDGAAALEDGGVSAIPEQARLALYRIAELALTNVARHARASSCEVRWDYEPEAGRLVLTIVDDGVGFASADGEPAAASNSLGLVTMNDYADALGGTCAIYSTPGHGTTVEVRLPLDGPAGPFARATLPVRAAADAHAPSPEWAPGPGS